MTKPYAEQPKEIKEIIERRLKAIKPLLRKHERGEPITREDYRKRSEECKARGWRGFSSTNLYRFLRRYVETYDKADLAPVDRPKGLKRKSQWPQEVLAYIDFVLRQDYLGKKVEVPEMIKHLPFLDPVYTASLGLNARAKLRYIYYIRTSNWPFFSKVPSFSVFERRSKAITTERERMALKEGEDAANAFYGKEHGWGNQGVIGVVDVTLPNELWEVDNTYVDLEVFDDKGVKIGRLWLTAVVDVATRCIVGYALEWSHPSYAMTQRALFNAISPKDEILRECGIDWDAKILGSHPWPARGMPKAVLVDNGKEFNNNCLIETCRVNKIKLGYAKVKTPEWRALVERVFKTLNTKFHHLRGSTYSNVVEKGDYKPEKDAWATYKKFEELLVIEICGHNNHEKRRFHGITPNELWERGVKECPPLLPKSKKTWRRLRISLLPFKESSLTKNGIQHNNRFYQNEELRPFVKKGKYTNYSRVPFYYDPLNIDRGFVYIEELGDYVEVQRVHRYPLDEIIEQLEIDRPLTEWDYKLAGGLWKNKFGCKSSPATREALARRLLEILADTPSSLLSGKEKKQKAQMEVDNQNRAIDEKVLSSNKAAATHPPRRVKKKTGGKKSRPATASDLPQSFEELWEDKRRERDNEISF